MPPESVKEFFDKLAAGVDTSKTAGMNNSYLFDIDGAGQRRVAVEDGNVTVTEGVGEADTTIQASEETMLAVVKGEQNPTTAYMTGKLKIKGDMGAAMKLQKLF
jgi:putative sterol carrier protein